MLRLASPSTYPAGSHMPMSAFIYACRQAGRLFMQLTRFYRSLNKVVQFKPTKALSYLSLCRGHTRSQDRTGPASQAEAPVISARVSAPLEDQHVHERVDLSARARSYIYNACIALIPGAGQ